MKSETKDCLRFCRMLKKGIHVLEKIGTNYDVRFPLSFFRTTLGDLEKRLPENPEAVPAFMRYQEYYKKKCAEVYS